jgi:hypothetical protein
LSGVDQDEEGNDLLQITEKRNNSQGESALCQVAEKPTCMPGKESEEEGRVTRDARRTGATPYSLVSGNAFQALQRRAAQGPDHLSLIYGATIAIEKNGLDCRDILWNS